MISLSIVSIVTAFNQPIKNSSMFPMASVIQAQIIENSIASYRITQQLPAHYRAPSLYLEDSPPMIWGSKLQGDEMPEFPSSDSYFHGSFEPLPSTIRAGNETRWRRQIDHPGRPQNWYCDPSG
mgnify:CR=1 FL=1